MSVRAAYSNDKSGLRRLVHDFELFFESRAISSAFFVASLYSLFFL